MSSENKNPNLNFKTFLSQRFFWILVGYLLFSVGLFFYYMAIVNPVWIHFNQQPSFFAEERFFIECLSVPGGLLDFIAAFLADLFQIGWLGAIILTALVLTSLLLLKTVMRQRLLWIVPLLPTVLLIAEQAKYDYPIVKTLSLIIALGGFLVYRDILPQKDWIRFGVDIPLLLLIYIASPAAMLLFAFLCVLYEISNKAHRLLIRLSFSASYVVLAIVIPWLAREKLFLISLEDAYLRHAPFWYGNVYGILTRIQIPLDAVVMVLILLLAGFSFFFKLENDRTKKQKFRMDLIQAVTAVCLIVAGGWMPIDQERKDVVALRYAAHTGNWSSVLSHLNSHTAQYPLCLFHFNRALFHTGQLGSKFFTIPQNVSHQTLFLDNDLCLWFPLDCSDFFFEIGHINQAKHWVSEAMTNFGESPDILKRLALIKILESDSAAASQYLNRLRQNPISRSWADHYLSCVVDRTKLRQEIGLQKLHAAMPRYDFLVVEKHPELDLRKMLSQSPNNRMAFEYLTMSDLINQDLEKFVQDLTLFKHFVTQPLPRHYEEALLVYLSRKQSWDSVAVAIGISSGTIKQFNDFRRRYIEHRGNKETAYTDLQKTYGGTFWFYYLFVKPSP
jgi:hypothetical protein